MREINPQNAAQLAQRIYEVQEPSLVDFFLEQSYLKQVKQSDFSPHKHLTAEVGGRVILNYKDGFGVCAQGDNDDELFLIFRGTTMANNVDANSAAFWQWVDSAIIYVLKKVTMGALISIQGAFISTFTTADKIAYILAKGIDLTENISIWVEHLMRKLMQALDMKVAKTKEELTHSLMRRVLTRITEKANKEARNALYRL